MPFPNGIFYRAFASNLPAHGKQQFTGDSKVPYPEAGCPGGDQAAVVKAAVQMSERLGEDTLANLEELAP